MLLKDDPATGNVASIAASAAVSDDAEPARLAAAAAEHRQRVLELLATSGIEVQARAWDAQIRAVVSAHPAAAAEWKLACALWWHLSAHGTARIVRQEARRLFEAGRHRFTLEDLEQGARIGLYRAAQSWRPLAGSWRWFARRGARMGVQNHMREGAAEAVHVPAHQRPRMWELWRELDLQRQRGEPRDVQAAAKRMGLERDLLLDLWAAHDSTSLDARVGEDPDSGSLYDLLGVPSHEEASVLRLDVGQLADRVRALPDRDQQTLIPYLAGRPPAELAREAGITVKAWYARYHAAMRRLVEAFELTEVPTQLERADLGAMVTRILNDGQPVTASAVGHRLGRQSSQIMGVLDRVGRRVPGTARPIRWVAR